MHPREDLARHISPLQVEKRWSQHSVEPDGKRLYAKHIKGVQLADRQIDSEPLTVGEALPILSIGDSNTFGKN